MRLRPNFLYLLLTLSALFFSPAWSKDLPEAVKTAARKVSDSTKAIRVSEYFYNGKSYYWVPAGHCCDMFDTLLDERGAVVCHPAGGIAGRGDGKCPEYVQKLEGTKKLEVHSLKPDKRQ